MHHENNAIYYKNVHVSKFRVNKITDQVHLNKRSISLTPRNKINAKINHPLNNTLNMINNLNSESLKASFANYNSDVDKDNKYKFPDIKNKHNKDYSKTHYLNDV